MSTLSKESYYLRDWVLSLGSNVHIATDEAWFSTLINFDSHVGKKPHILPVKGVGVVELELESRGHGAGHKLVLEPVLYVPDYFCNIIGGPIISSNGHKYNVDFNTSKLTITSTDEAVGTFETKPFMHLRLSGHEPGWSIFENDVADQLRILVTWPGDEQNRWKAFVAGEEYIKNAVTVTPLDADEKAWVKRVYKHEYRFLAQHGLSIHVQDDRVLGWKLAREEMKHRVATEQTLVKELKPSTSKSNQLPTNTEPAKDIDGDRGKENQTPDDQTMPDKANGQGYIPPHMRVLLGIKIP